LDASGLPWFEANIYILSRLENSYSPAMSTYDGIADDLTAYRRFIDEEAIDWRTFPTQKLSRPTYRYCSHLRSAIASGAIKTSSAKRRMSSVIAFYTWIANEGILTPANPPWKESDVSFKLRDSYGLEFSKRIRTTDISIRIPKQTDPFGGRIDDGGKLRPLPLNEQRWVVEALLEHRNTEMALIHLIALLTGARIQTVLTIQINHVRKFEMDFSEANSAKEIRCPIGPGTGIDTKRDKRMSLHFPMWLCCMMLTYAESERARSRRKLAKGGDNGQQYLFLSKFGTPFYRSKADSGNFDPNCNKRHPIKGQSVRKYMSEVIIPYVQAKYDARFRYQFHDLRASFGMNLTDTQLKLVESKTRTLSQVREFVKVRMGHDSVSTTDRYLQFQGNYTHILAVVDGHDDHFRRIVLQAGLL
jgi:integrase